MKKLIKDIYQKILDNLPDKIYTQLRYLRTFKRRLNLKNPQTLNEKIQWKKLYDRKKFYTLCGDKYLAREYIKERIGEKYLVPLLYVTNKPEEIPFDKLPLPYIIKPNHCSGYFIVVRDKKDINKNELIKQCRKWLKIDYYKYGKEWQYKNIPRKIIIEKLLVDKAEKVPADCRFFCFNGKVKLIQMDIDRFEDHRRGLFSIDWKLLPFNWSPLIDGEAKYKIKEGIPKPKNLKEMIRIAEILSKDFDFIRVDLYSVGSKIYAGELTFHPGGGFNHFIPEKYDLIYGRKLKLKGFKKK